MVRVLAHPLHVAEEIAGTVLRLIVVCGPGTYSSDGRPPCSLCAVGTYQPDYGRVNCRSCGSGITTDAVGATSFRQCRVAGRTRCVWSVLEMMVLKLIKTYCLPRLLYGCEIWSIETIDMHELDVIWNNGFRHIFNCCWSDSVKPLQFFLSIYAAIIFDWGKTVDVL